MNAIDEIQAAIVKLTEMKAQSTPGPWHEWQNDLSDRIEVWHDQEQRLWVADLGEHGPTGSALADANLIVTLHATIDAQLAFLLDAANRIAVEENRAGIELYYRSALTLARAINGAVQS